MLPRPHSSWLLYAAGDAEKLAVRRTDMGPNQPHEPQVTLHLDAVDGLVREICDAVVNDVTQPRVERARLGTLDHAANEVLAQTIAFSAMAEMAYFQLPDSAQLRAVVDAESGRVVAETMAAAARAADRPLLYGADGDVVPPANFGAFGALANPPQITDEEYLGDAGEPWPGELGTCAICGCSDDRACDDGRTASGGCTWIEPGVCSACVAPDWLVQVGALRDFVGKAVRLLSDEELMVDAVDGPVATVRHAAGGDEPGCWLEPSKMHAGTSCIYFTQELRPDVATD